ncbi:hypothetical protein [Candidatus Vampirococcus lugosii]|uniref:Uncharacterized protein n=1 Tax=Candidatus Vampirococcus lugosii TaxID=2789015 RepID=A0ABS5QMA0_9BACT|nr:hypothetical protein [Candidatus Vampirococcus lugosii]MBS8122335.1 hypothetical protein [Candidatus Vampirococcus lugosii]
MIKFIFKFILLILFPFFSFFSFSYAQDDGGGDTGGGDTGDGGGGDTGDGGGGECDGIELNTNVPFIRKCLEKENADTAFPKLMGGLSKIVITFTLVIAFLMVVAGGVLITMSGADQSNFSKGKELIIKVIVGIVLLGSSGVILYMINPNFFS